MCIMNHIAKIYQGIFAESNWDIPKKLLVLIWFGEGTARILCTVHGLPTFQVDDETIDGGSSGFDSPCPNFSLIFFRNPG
jgi:hypothetical protein